MIFTNLYIQRKLSHETPKIAFVAEIILVEKKRKRLPLSLNKKSR